MSSPALKPVFTETEYLEFERAAAQRHLYVDGEIFAMAGETGEHGDISANLVGSLVTQLRGKRCRVRTKGTRVRSGPQPKSKSASQGMYSYPDVVVICGEPEYQDHVHDVVLNPQVIIEVFSDHTERFDRGEKFQRYQRWNPSLSDYILVSTSRPEMEHFTRQGDNSWSYQRHFGLAAACTVASIGCELPLAEVYDRILFSPEVLEE